jgi:diguanylate cyclase (GGDEF)-like protein/PAS domain S-box-containing protein
MPRFDVDALVHPAFSIVLGSDGSFVFANINEALCALTGLTKAMVVGRTATEFACAEDAAEFEDNYRRCFASRKVEEYEETTQMPHGRRWWRTTLTPVLDEHGRMVEILGLCTDITARKLAETELHSAAFSDPLTGVGNRRRFDRDLDHAMGRAAATRKPFSIIVADLDRFKSINDRFGHGTGDEVLRQAAQRLRQGMRETDQLARIGGDEFTAIVSAATTGAVAVTMERIQRQFRTTLACGGIAVPLTVSLGAATWASGISATELLAAADGAMYASKRQAAG